MPRCIDLVIGQKVLSYDLLEGPEKDEMDAHLERCEACRDLLQQSFGKEGALDALVWRAYRLSQRRPVEGGAWFAERLRDLALPFLVFAVVIGSLAYLVSQRTAEPERVGVRRLALARGGVIDSLPGTLVPRIEAGPVSLLVRTDRAARAYLYEARQGTLKRLLPPEGAAPPAVSPDSTRELPVPALQGSDSRVLLLLVPRDAPGSTDEWDAAVMAELGGKPPNSTPTHAAGGPWPTGAVPTLRWLR